MFTFEDAKRAYFNEDACELSLADEKTLNALVEWLDANDYDGGFAIRLWDMGDEEMRCMMAEAKAEFGI
tara:strand:- start:818 stop:1024 length:207 start_codon:yes stop_codon:yes gene_type:complete